MWGCLYRHVIYMLSIVISGFYVNRLYIYQPKKYEIKLNKHAITNRQRLIPAFAGTCPLAGNDVYLQFMFLSRSQFDATKLRDFMEFQGQLKIPSPSTSKNNLCLTVKIVLLNLY